MAFNRDKFRSFLSPKKEEVVLEVEQPKEPQKPIKENKIVLDVEEIVELPKEQPKPLNEKEEFAKLDLSKDDLLELKKIAFVDMLQEDISISELVDLVLLAKSNKEIKTKNRDALCLREYVDVKGKITTKGKVYLEEDATKNRLKEILQ